MDREQAREYIKGKLEKYLSSKGINTEKPFRCLNPEHKDNKPSMSFDRRRNKAHCFSCGADYDTFDLIAIDESLRDDKEIFKRAYEIFRVDVDGSGTRKNQKEAKSERYTDKSMSINAYVQEYTDKDKSDFAAYFKECQARISETDYPQRRGLSAEVVKRFGLGYDPKWKHPKAAASVPMTPRLIIPTSAESYLARDTRAEIPEHEKQYKAMKAGKVRMFNIEAVRNAQKPVFIVEGEIDALSIINAGGEAVALGSVANVQRLLSLLEREKPKQRLIIATDNDKAGDEAARKLAEGFVALEIPFYRHVWESCKDANEALLIDRDTFREKVQVVEDIEHEKEKAEREAYLKTSAAYHLQAFIDGIADSVNTPFIPTGFHKLDKILDGGLFEGLYILGAISSNGKTSFALQIADQIAQAGNDVLIFSLEMSRFELMAKSISRGTLIEVMETDGDTRKAKTTRGITTGARYEVYSREEKELIETAVRNYEKYAGRIYISEGIGSIGTDQIREEVKKHFSFTGNRPVVFIDYLQILAPYDARATDKQNIDKATMELKRISRDFKIPILGISSFNRANYKEAVTMEAFKESGAIEYSSDVLIGLQLKGAGAKNFDVDKAKNENPRRIELVILKNRNGATGKRIDFEYYPLFNFFTEYVGETSETRL